MTNLATGKALTRRDSLKGLAAIFAAGCAPALLGQTARGLMHRNLGGRIATMGGFPDWCSPLLAATWPNSMEFREITADTKNYNDIYATY